MVIHLNRWHLLNVFFFLILLGKFSGRIASLLSQSIIKVTVGLPRFKITHGYKNFQLIHKITATIPNVKMKTKSIYAYNKCLTVMHIAILHSITHISVEVFFFFFHQGHHALLDRECKSMNTYFLLVFHPFSVKKPADHWIHSVSSEVVISSPLDSWPLQTQYHIYVSTCVGLELSVPWSELFLVYYWYTTVERQAIMLREAAR